MKKIGFYAGSFDPFTKGHLAIVCEALCAFDEVIIGIGVNSAKKTLFNHQEREKLIASSIDDFICFFRYRQLSRKIFSETEFKAASRLINEPECLKIVSYDGLTIDAAIRNGANTLIRGERIVGDHDSEMALAFVNRELLAIRRQHLDLITLSVPDVKLTYISSTAVKNLCSLGEFIAAQKYVMPSVHQALMIKYLNPYYVLFALSACVPLWTELCRAYSEGRFYHNLSHIGYCLNYANIYAGIMREECVSVLSKDEKPALYAAIFYHDYFCSGREDDEVRSAQKAKEDLQIAGNSFPDIEQLVMMTKHTGNYIEVPLVYQLIHDVDLAILGDRDNYGTYAMQIRREYSQYDTKSYARKRCEVLRQLLDTDYLYLTEFFRKAFQENAELNIKTELAYWEERM